MNPQLSQAHLASYLTGVALGVGLLASAVIGGMQWHVERWPPAAAPALCAGQVSFDQAEQLRAEVVALQIKRNALLAGGSAYAAAKFGLPSALSAPALAADSQLKAARGRFAAVCGVQS